MKMYFEDLEEGTVFRGDECVADRDEMLEYARKNDPSPLPVVRPLSSALAGRLLRVLTAVSGTYLPVVKPLTSMPGIVGGADLDFEVPKCPAIDRPERSSRGVVNGE